MNGERLTRRGSIVGFGGFLLGLLGWKASRSEGARPRGVASGAVTCVLTPEQTEGPYYIAGEKVRRNITEGRPGTPLPLRLRSSTPRPASRSRAPPSTSGTATRAASTRASAPGAASRTFMRGIQRTDATGLALSRRVYPGWYQGRTVHIHVKVHLGGNVVHTGQLYFPDTLTDAVYRRARTADAPEAATRNATTSSSPNGGKRSMVAPAQGAARGYVGRSRWASTARPAPRRMS